MKDALMRDKYNSKNERLKYAYRMYLAGIKHCDKKTWLNALKHIRYYEMSRGFANFIPLSGKDINDYVNEVGQSGKSLSYMRQNFKIISDFYIWLEKQKGYRNKINLDNIEMFSLTTNQYKTASASEYKESYKIEDILGVIRSMPDKTYIDQRNKAMISLQSLCGLRIGELRTIKLKNIKFDNIANNWFVYVSPKNMAVKFAKVRHAYFMAWDDDIRDNVLRWVDKLREFGWTDDAPVFPALYDDFGQSDLLQTVHTPSEIKSGTTIIKLFKDTFTGAGLPYYRPHSFRDTISIWSELNGTPAFFNAVSQSLGHSSPKTTFSIYGKFPPARIGEIMKNNPVGSPSVAP